MVLALAMPPMLMGAGSADGPAPMPTAAGIRGAVEHLVDWVTATTPPKPHIPQQQAGKAPGKQHQVPAAVTRAVARAEGYVPGKGPGQLPAYTFPAAKVKQHATGVADLGDAASYNPATSKLVPSGATATSALYRNADGTYDYTWTPDGTLTGTAVAGASGSGVLDLTDEHTDLTGQFTTTGTTLSGSQTFGPWGTTTATGGTLTGSLGYQSQYTSPTTGQVDMGARWYNPATGSFGNKDTASNKPVPDSASASPFGYAADNPLGATDPTGHMLTPPPGDTNYASDEQALLKAEAAAQKAAIARAAAAAKAAAAAEAAKKAAAAKVAAAKAAAAAAAAKTKAKAAATSKPTTSTSTKPYDGPLVCPENDLTACMLASYEASGGQVDSQGIPTGQGYVPPKLTAAQIKVENDAAKTATAEANAVIKAAGGLKAIVSTKPDTPTPITSTKFVNPSQSGLPASYYKYLAGITWAGGLRTVSQFFAGKPAQANGDFTLILSEVDVETDPGVVVPRIVGFVSSGGLPKSLRLQFQDQNIPILRATSAEAHAEQAAQSFANNELNQQIELDGTVVRVNSAVMNNTPCSQPCADAFNSYANTGRSASGDDAVAITTEDRGFLPNGQVLTPAYSAELTEMGGGSNVFGGLANIAQGAAAEDDDE